MSAARIRYPQVGVWTRRMSHPAMRRHWRTRVVFWLGAVAIGLVAAGFAVGCDWAMHAHARLVSRWPLAGAALTPSMFVLVVWATRRFAPASRGSGIPQAIAALDLAESSARCRLLSMRIAAAKVLLTMLALLGGAAIGREGPTVHIGASMMDALGRLARFPYDYLKRSLVLAGSAAGLAAAFNTPIAGVVFAVEEMARSFEERSSGTLLTAVVLAGMVSTSLLGNYAYFGTSDAQLPAFAAWLGVPVCGLVGGIAGGLFSRAWIDGGRRLAGLAERRPLRLAFLLGLLVAGLGLASHGVTYGTGYDQARGLLTGRTDPGAWFPLLKALAALASYFTGTPGGIFAPSLSIGAGLGADLAGLVPQAPGGAMVVLGMVAYFTGVTQSPLTGAVIVMEMVDGHGMILPMLASSYIALGASRLVCSHQVYRALAVAFLAGPAALARPPRAGQ